MWRARRGFLPQLVDERVDRRHPAGLERESREQGTLLPGRDRDRAVAVCDLDRPQEPHLHGLMMTPAEALERGLNAA